jgi:hypothetical protein
MVPDILGLHVALIEKSQKLHIHDPKRRQCAIYAQKLCNAPLEIKLMHVGNHIYAKYAKPLQS